MNINKQYAWQSGANSSCENNPLLPVRGLVIGKNGCGKTTVIFNLLLPPNWLDYNHLYVFGKESPPAGVQGVAKRIRSRLEQAADFQIKKRYV